MSSKGIFYLTAVERDALNGLAKFKASKSHSASCPFDMKRQMHSSNF
jgi:hypothetical protein